MRIRYFLIALLLAVVLYSCGPLSDANKSFEMENYALTIEQARNVFAADSTNDKAIYLIGRAFFKMGELDSAAASFQKARSIAPENLMYTNKLAETYVAMGDQAAEQGEPRDAIKEYERALDLLPDTAFILEKKADALRASGRVNDARIIYINIRDGYSDSVRVENKLADMDRLFDEAKQHYETGMTALNAKKFERAVKQFEQALELKPDYKEARYQQHMAKGRDLYKQGSKSDLWDAIMEFGYAATLKPESGEPHYWMGMAYNKKDRKEYDNAIREFETAVKVDPDGEFAEISARKAEDIRNLKKKMEEFWSN